MTPGRKPLIPSSVVIAVLLVLVGLLVAVVLVGLVRDTLNADGLVIALMPVISGIILGFGVRFGGGNYRDSD